MRPTWIGLACPAIQLDHNCLQSSILFYISEHTGCLSFPRFKKYKIVHVSFHCDVYSCMSSNGTKALTEFCMCVTLTWANPTVFSGVIPVHTISKLPSNSQHRKLESMIPLKTPAGKRVFLFLLTCLFYEDKQCKIEQIYECVISGNLFLPQ